MFSRGLSVNGRKAFEWHLLVAALVALSVTLVTLAGVSNACPRCELSPQLRELSPQLREQRHSPSQQHELALAGPPRPRSRRVAGGLGTLVRDRGSGSLVLPAGAPSMDLWVLLRLYPRDGGCDVALVALHTLAAATRQLAGERSGLSVSVHVRLFISDAFPEAQSARWVLRAVSMFGDAAEVSSQRCAAGNVPSYDSVMMFVRDQAAAGVMVNTSVVYVCEDDYIHATSELVEVMSLFASHDPPFVIPYDYPDRYTRSDNRDDGAVSVVAGLHRHWRTRRV